MSRSILLTVDPDPRIAARIAEIFRGEPVLNLSAGTASEAIALLRAQPVVALFCELALPDLNGISLLVSAQQLRPEVAGVVMTDRPSIESCVEAMRNGARDYLFKPISAQKVQAAWQRLARRFGPILGAHATVANSERADAEREQTERASAAFRLDPPHALGRTSLGEPLADTNENSLTVPLHGDLKEIERNLVRQVVRRFDGNKTAAAKALGMHRKTLYRVLEREPHQAE
ncbi:MAG TPA: response regulator [Pirellulales bacterium]|jgi:DNA-binding NtrC family response regulator|nr:response regulator [Pirellulales bacterium]